MIKISKTTTLKEIITDTNCNENQYMISPMQEVNYGFIPDISLQNKIKEMVAGREFAELSLEEITKIFTAWNLPSIIEGFEHLVKQADKQQVFFQLSEETGIAAFPLEKKSKFVLICPGGGYENVCSMAEGFPIAAALNQMGYAAFVLYYHTGEKAQAPYPMDDLAQALRFITEHADEYHIDTDRYAVIGFSAGGHLAASFGTRTLGYQKYGLPKPDIMILGYPVITMGDKTHEGSRTMLLGEKYSDNKKLVEQYSMEKQITNDYPEVFIWQCENDEVVPFENSSVFVEALKKNHIPYSYEIFPGGDHGWGLGTGTAADGWLIRAMEFWENSQRNYDADK